jgi:putative phosphoesterase
MSKLLIVSDIHGNWPALWAVLAAEHRFDAAVFCGDVVDYGPLPAECLHWVRRNCAYAVRGNHDNALATGEDCRCMGSFRSYSVATRAWHRSMLPETDLHFLAELPVVACFEWEGRRFRMAHATPQGNMFEYLDPKDWEERVRGLDADFVLLGHTHIQGIREFGRITVANPGSVGLARDHAGLACYAIYAAGKLTLKRVPYDISQTIAALRRAPLPDSVVRGLAAALSPRAANDFPGGAMEA